MNTQELLDELDREAVNWSATCGDLFGRAAAEIRRQRNLIDDLLRERAVLIRQAKQSEGTD